MKDLAKELKSVKREMKNQKMEMKALKRKAAGIESQFSELLNEHKNNIERNRKRAKRVIPKRPCRPQMKKTDANMSNLLKQMKL